MIRIFQAIPLKVGETVSLDEAASHHLSRVLRIELADQVILFNGQGGEYQGSLTHVSKKRVDVYLETFSEPAVESPLNICLVQGLVRGEKMDFIVQKAVEMGVASLQPLLTNYSNVRLSKERTEKRLKHWQAVAVSACEQSGRTRVPSILEPKSYNDWINNNQNKPGYILCPHSEGVDLSKQTLAGDTLNLLVGPEGGFSSDEVAVAIAQGVRPLNLGPRILRTETAPIAAISLLNYCFGDYRVC